MRKQYDDHSIYKRPYQLNKSFSVALNFLNSTKKRFNTLLSLETTQMPITPAGYLVIIVWLTSLLEETIQWPFHLQKALSTEKILLLEKNLMMEPFALAQFNNFFTCLGRLPSSNWSEDASYLVHKRLGLAALCLCGLSWCSQSSYWVLLKVAWLDLRWGFSRGQHKKQGVKILSLLAFWVALRTWPDSSKCL